MDQNKYHNILNLQINDDLLSFDLDGQHYNFSLSENSKRLAKASKSEREIFRLSPSGYGIHWPLVDEDLSIDGLLGIKHSPEVDLVNTKVH
jgi:hypothetical protein